MATAQRWRDRATMQIELARYLQGDGVELGPGHSPYPLRFPGTRVRYVDRWEPDANRALFPELGPAVFPKPHIVSNLDTDRLSELEDASQDFVIASHVLEHVANPIALIGEIFRVLRPGGVTLILMPDRRRTFDRMRGPTSLEHLAAEYRSDVRDVADDHIEDFLRGVGEWDESWGPAERAQQYALHRERSIHVHCWDERQFFEVVQFTISEIDLRWELLDAVFVDDVDDSIEFGYVLLKPVRPLDASVCVDRIGAVWKTLAEHSSDRAARDAAAVQTFGVGPERADASSSVPGGPRLASWEALLDRLRRSRAAPAFRAARRTGRRLRKRVSGTAE
jgi:SAM-dependent methyltransferase